MELDKAVDERGYFARTFSREDFAARGLIDSFVQNSLSFNRLKGTLRGMHYQAEPHGEVKLVQCIRGAVFDVAVDLRPGSQTCGRWYGVELNQDNGQLLYVPRGFAHGFMTLADNTALYYMISTAYAPDYARGVRWDDPAFGIKWPGLETVMSDRDRKWPDWKL